MDGKAFRERICYVIKRGMELQKLPMNFILENLEICKRVRVCISGKVIFCEYCDGSGRKREHTLRKIVLSVSMEVNLNGELIGEKVFKW